MRDANGDTLAPWRDNVRAAAVVQVAASPDRRGFGAAPVVVRAKFTFARPKAHFGTGRNAAVVKPTAPAYPASHAVGDLDKLLRAGFDALTDAGVWADDSQVVHVAARKVWVGDPMALDRPGVVIDVIAAVPASDAAANQVAS
jgi:crossover junction endodeoxyribonuclease RusA